MRQFVPVFVLTAALALVYLAYQQYGARSAEQSYRLGDNRRASLAQLTRMNVPGLRDNLRLLEACFRA